MKNKYLHYNELLNDLSKYMLNKEETNTENIQFFLSKEWVTEEVIQDLLTIRKQMLSNAAKLGLKRSSEKIGRPSKRNDIRRAVKMYNDGVRPVKKILQETGVSKSTLYDNIKVYYDEL